MKIHIVIVTYNAEHWLYNCLNSLATSSVPLEVVVVDNKSTDNTVDIIEKQYPHVKLFKSSSNLGFGKGNNIGINYALQNGADYVFLLNQDAYLNPNTISVLVKASQNNPQFGIISPIHLSGNPAIPDRQFVSYVSPPNCHTLYPDYLANKDNMKEIYETQFVNAALWLLPRNVLLTVGGFDPVFPHYGEDNDFVHRIIYHGYKVGVCPHTTATHDRLQAPLPGAPVTQAQKPVANDAATMAKKRFNLRYKEYLISLKNLKLNDAALKRDLYKRMVKSCINFLLKRQFSDISNEVKVVNLLVSQMDTIMESRQLSRNGNAPFLDASPNNNVNKA
jgi:GT2 family glycosyltransferase